MYVNTSSVAQLTCGILASLLACGLPGCGADSQETHHLSGKVTFDGNPVPNGVIRFTPDGSKGNSGSPGFAVIKDGKYDTSEEGGQGHVSGPMIVVIEGSDTLPGRVPTDKSGIEPDIKVLFTGYQTEADLPKEDSTKDFDVPAAAGKRKDEPEGRVQQGRGEP